MFICQAVFTSAATNFSDGYHLVRRSRGINPTDAAALAAWGPGHDALLPGVTESLNFHPLPSGTFCVSVTTTAGEEPSRRRGPKLLTHCLVVHREDFIRLGCDPSKVATLAARYASPEAPSPAAGDATVEELELIEPPDSAVALPKARSRPAADTVVELIRLLREGASIAVFTGGLGATYLPGKTPPTARPIALVQEIFAHLTPEERIEMPFSTGLRHSPRRLYRVLFVHETDSMAARRLIRQFGMTLYAPTVVAT